MVEDDNRRTAHGRDAVPGLLDGQRLVHPRSRPAKDATRPVSRTPDDRRLPRGVQPTVAVPVPPVDNVVERHMPPRYVAPVKDADVLV